MLTQCPNCQTTFRVTSEILRVADGQVRCGRCQTQFDALERLLDEPDGAESSGRFMRPPARRAPTPAPTEEHIEVEEPDAQEDITLQGGTIAISGVYRTVDENGEAHEEVREEITEEWIEDESALEQENLGSNEIEVVEPQADLEEIASELETSEADRVSENVPVHDRAAPADAEFDLVEQPSPRTGSRWWALGAPLLVLLLAAQLIHHYRTSLARHPTFGAPLSALYGAVGLQLTPEWDLHAYEIRQWGVISDPSHPGALRVRASVTNLAPFAQPYPLLRLVLEDRWGDQVRARAFKPDEYLEKPAPGLLAPAQQANATIIIVDPGTDAESFRFDVCLPARQGAVCAENVPHPSP